jgi:chaperonin GroES
MAAKKGKKSGGTSLVPLADRVLVERLEAEEKTAGGIVLPDSAKEKPLQGKVIAVGEGRRSESGELVAPQVSPGDRVLFAKYGGTEVEVEGEDYLILKEDDILAILED